MGPYNTKKIMVETTDQNYSKKLYSLLVVYDWKLIQV